MTRRVTVLTKLLAIVGMLGLVGPVTLTSPPKTQAADTVVSSVNFDDHTTGTWTQSGSPTLDYTANGAGNLALKITRNADYEGIQSPTGLLEKDVQYTFSMKAMLDPAGTVTSSSIRFVVKPKYNWVANTTINNTGWTTVTGTYTLPSDVDPTTAQIYIGTADLDPKAAYTVLIDDILITSGGGDTLPPGTGVLNSNCSGGYVGLTYDDGPYAGQTNQLVNALTTAGLRATFFDWGAHISGNSALVQAQFANGWVGNHSWSHPHLNLLDLAAVMKELSDTQAALKGITGVDPVLFRPPYLETNATIKAAEQSLGLTEIMADVDSLDWNGATTAQIVAKVHNAQPGQVVLMHDNLQTTRDAIPYIADDFSARNVCPGMINPTTGKAVAPPGKVALNTDFENGGLDGWAPRTGDTDAPTVTWTTTSAHSPTHAALVSGRTTSGDGIQHDVTGKMVAGKTYDISAWVKFASTPGDGMIWLSMHLKTGSTDDYKTVAQFPNIGTTWAQVTTTYQMPQADSAEIYFETKYQSGNLNDFLVDDINVQEQSGPQIQKDLTNLKDTVSFPIGVAIDSRETTGAYAELVKKHFDQVTPENYMKPEAWYDSNKTFGLPAEAKALMDFAQANNLRVYGHTLVWHSQTPDWFFQRTDGTPLTNSDADKAILRNRLHDHIFNVAKALSDSYGLFGSSTNPLVAFDVVNEVISDDSSTSDGLRRSAWYNVLGPEFIDDAFTYAEQAFNHQYAAASANRPIKLTINDYNTEQSGKRDRLHALVKSLLTKGLHVDNVGHQFHVSLSTPIQGLDDAFNAFKDLPVKQVVSELDVMAGASPTSATLVDQGYYYRDAFRIFRNHASDIFSVTVWGLYDGRSWRSSDAPLLFNDALQAKPAFMGAIDGTLAARTRTALVFQANVPIDANASTAVEWQKLPLRLFGDGDKVGFQLRWQPDHLTAYVMVKDSTTNASDAITFKLGNQTYILKRDGTGGATGVRQEVSGGWKAVVSLPLSNAKQGDTQQFDVTVTDGATTASWNDPGAVGTLTLVEPISFVDVKEAATAPAIDGDSSDAAWANANTVTTDKQVSGTNTAKADVKVLWKANYLYVLAHVKDATLDDTASNPWEKDSVEIYVDAGNFKNGTYRSDDTQIRINYKGELSFGTGDENAQKARVTRATQTVSDGYVVEAKIDLLTYGGLGTFQGMDFQVNDAANGGRLGTTNWADATNQGYLSTAHWGVGRLVDQAGNVPAPAPTATPTPAPSGATPTPTVTPPPTSQVDGGNGSSGTIVTALGLLGLFVAFAAFMVRSYKPRKQ